MRREGGNTRGAGPKHERQTPLRDAWADGASSFLGGLSRRGISGPVTPLNTEAQTVWGHRAGCAHRQCPASPQTEPW